MATASKFASANAVVTTGWTSPTNAYADDTSYATASPGRNATIDSDFKFADFASGDIPDGSTINSVTITARAWGSNATYMTEGIRGRVSGADNGTEGTTTSTTEVTISCTLSGVTLANLRAASTTVFARVRASKGATNTAYTGSLDWVQITVDYTGPVAKTGTAETGTGTDTATKSEAKSGTAESGTGTGTASLATAVPTLGGGTATVTKTWVWATTTESWTSYENNDITVAVTLAGEGAPAYALSIYSTTYSFGSGSGGAFYGDVSWVTLGVPSGATVTRVRATGGQVKRSTWSAPSGSTGVALRSRITNTDGSIDIASLGDGVGVDSVDADFNDLPAANGLQSVDSSYQASSTLVRVYLDGYFECGAGGNLWSDVLVDNFAIEIEYTTAGGGGVETGTATDSATKEESSGGTPKTGTLETGTATDASSLVAACTGTAESGTGSDAATQVYLRSSTAESGTGTDAASLAAAVTGAAESGAGSDSATLTAAESGTAESGTGSDVASVIQYKTGAAESGTATDVSSACSAAIVGAAESGTGSDTSVLVAILSVRTESGTGAETSSLAAAIAATAEVGTGADPPASKEESGVDATKFGDDAGAASDVATLASALSGSSESGAASDVATLASALSGAAESGAASDVATQNYPRSSTAESGTGADTVALVATPVGAAESGTATDTSSAPLVALSGAAESGTGSDTSAAPVVAVTGTAEIGTASDYSSERVAFDTGVASETATLVVVLATRTDSGAETEVADRWQYKTGAAESGTGADTSALVALRVGTAESGTGSDAAALVATPVGAAESGAASDVATLASARSGAAESGTGSDTSARTAALTGAAETGTGGETSALNKGLLGSAETGTATDSASLAVSMVGTLGSMVHDGSFERSGYAAVPDASGTYLYFCDYDNNMVKRIRTSDMVVVASCDLAVNDGPISICIDSTDSYLYVANSTGLSVKKIATSTMTVVGTKVVGTGYDPTTIAISRDDSFVVVGTYVIATSAASIIKIRTSDMYQLQLNTLPGGWYPRQIVPDPTGTTFYCSAGNQLLRLTSNGGWDWNLNLNGTGWGVATDAQYHVYVAVPSQEVVKKVRLSDFALVDTLSVPLTPPTWLAHNTAGTYLYGIGGDVIGGVNRAYVCAIQTSSSFSLTYASLINAPPPRSLSAPATTSLYAVCSKGLVIKIDRASLDDVWSPEQGTVTETSALTGDQAKAGFDSGLLIEAPAIRQLYKTGVAESGTGTESFVSIVWQKYGADMGSLLEAVTDRALGFSDRGMGVEVPSVAALLQTRSDTSVLLETSKVVDKGGALGLEYVRLMFGMGRRYRQRDHKAL